MITAQISQSEWVKLPTYVRQRMATIFQLTRSTGSFIQSNELKSDGYTQTDLQGISLEELQAFYETESTDFFDLFNRLVDELALEEKNGQKIANPDHLLISGWTRKLNDIRSEALESNLIDKLNNTVRLVFFGELAESNVNENRKKEEFSPAKNKGTKKRGRKAKKNS